MQLKESGIQVPLKKNPESITSNPESSKWSPESKAGFDYLTRGDLMWYYPKELVLAIFWLKLSGNIYAYCVFDRQ